MARPPSTLTELARLGFAELGAAGERIEAVPRALWSAFSEVGDPDAALRRLGRIADRGPEALTSLLRDEEAAARLVRLLGASSGIAGFFERNPAELDALRIPLHAPRTEAEYRAGLTEAIRDLSGEPGRVALRVRYRRELSLLAAWDLEAGEPLLVLPQVAAALADLAGAALDAALALARRDSRYPAADVAATRLAIIGMGKAGARELNYVSDVDVIFAARAAEGEDGTSLIPDHRAVAVATSLAMATGRGITELSLEPPLWEVDANLRPEGKDGALVRTIESHRAYYERWAKNWEFQALLKARPLAGDLELGQDYVAALSPMVWGSSARDGFVESVQRMRERVTAHIPAGEVDRQLKLGPGGLRDVEFTVQLLQLVHGAHDPALRKPSTLEALDALTAAGYVGRQDASELGRDYRFLRVLEHRLQLARLRRTHLMPDDERELRALARASGLGLGTDELVEEWQRIKREVRRLHERIFYRPLLAAVAAMPEGGTELTTEQAQARLAAIGFRDSAGALRHIAALTQGVSRRAAIQRTLLPVILEWLAEGADPDAGLLAFRRMSDDLGETHWFLRMLRDSAGVAKRLTHVLSSGRFVPTLFERIPEAAAWLEQNEELQVRAPGVLVDEAIATAVRHADDIEAGALAIRTLRRREVLRLALGAELGLIGVHELGRGLAAVTTATIEGMLRLVHRWGDGIEFGVIAMGRYGGRELGFGSDADVMYVYRAAGLELGEAQTRAEGLVHELVRLTEDLRLPLDLDNGLRPEGKNGAIVRSLESYRAYYARWSLTWEAQALLRSRGAVGDEALLEEFERLADEVRYPASISPESLREIKRIKARVESERLPRGADPSRHLKLGRGSLSDVEWLVQLLQLQHGARIPALRTTSTLAALEAAQEAELIEPKDAEQLREAWLIASRARSALTLWAGKTTDLLPVDHRDLEGVARLLEYPSGSALRFEDDYLRRTRLARRVFERLFYGPSTG